MSRLCFCLCVGALSAVSDFVDEVVRLSKPNFRGIPALSTRASQDVLATASPDQIQQLITALDSGEFRLPLDDILTLAKTSGDGHLAEALFRHAGVRSLLDDLDISALSDVLVVHGPASPVIVDAVLNMPSGYVKSRVLPLAKIYYEYTERRSVRPSFVKRRCKLKRFGIFNLPCCGQSRYFRSSRVVVSVHVLGFNENVLSLFRFVVLPSNAHYEPFVGLVNARVHWVRLFAWSRKRMQDFVVDRIVAVDCDEALGVEVGQMKDEAVPGEASNSGFVYLRDANTC